STISAGVCLRAGAGRTATERAGFVAAIACRPAPLLRRRGRNRHDRGPRVVPHGTDVSSRLRAPRARRRRKRRPPVSASKTSAGSYVEDLYLLQRVAQRINSTLDPDVLLEQIVEDVSNTFGYNRVGVLLKEANADELVIAAGWTGELCLKGTRFKVGEAG